MNTKHVVGLVALASLTFQSKANAQQMTTNTSDPSEDVSQDYFSQSVPAPRNAFELTLGTGYTQPFGMLQSGVNMDQVATPGIGVEVGAASRMSTRWSLGVEAQYQELTAERASGARGMTAGIAAQYHIAPAVRSDPWIKLGTGYRLLWETQPSTPTLLTHGFELGKLSAGLDLRFSPDVAVAPVVGADLNVFLWQDAGTSVAIANPRVNTFLFAGLQGRFDFTNQHEGRLTASR